MVTKGSFRETLPSIGAGPESGVRRAPNVHELKAEIERLHEECERYRRQLVVDPISGSYTRRHFEERLEHEWRRAQHFWSSLSLLVVDVVAPSRLFEHGGQASLDRALAHVGWLLRSYGRDIDISGRVGPTSFAVLLPGTGRIGAEAELSRLEALARRYPPDLPAGESLSLGFGMAVAFDDAHAPLELLIMADAAAVEARRSESDDDRHETIPILRPPSCVPAA